LSSFPSAMMTTRMTTANENGVVGPQPKRRSHAGNDGDGGEQSPTMMTAIPSSGATVACCMVIPNYPPPHEEGSSRVGSRQRGKCYGPVSISVHATNAGDARAVQSLDTATHRHQHSHGCNGGQSHSISNHGLNTVTVPCVRPLFLMRGVSPPCPTQVLLPHL
jgi:hypothetical protein